MPIPVIDLFAGPGGLGEGFSSIFDENENKVFKIKLSIEKDENAHSTLLLRSFYRQFKKKEVPDAYYRVLQQTNLADRGKHKDLLFKKYPDEFNAARNEAWLAELGSPKYPSEEVDKRIEEALQGEKNWLLIGGPPCQAYSLAGRSRVGGIDKEDHRVYLYKEYLRIIAKHQPSVFVMENVKGLLSAKLNNENIFEWIKRDLKEPASVFPYLQSKQYRIYSLTASAEKNFDGEPDYENDRDFLIESEKYGIPQKRHRVIILGIRNDIITEPNVLTRQHKKITLKDVIDDLPQIRSVLGRSFRKIEINGKNKRIYEKVYDSDENWRKLIQEFKDEITSWNGFSEESKNSEISLPAYGTGSEFIRYQMPKNTNPLAEWYYDERLGGVCNHESRSHLLQDLKRYLFSSIYTMEQNRFPRLSEFAKHARGLLPEHENVLSGKFADRFRVQLANEPATTVTSHISKDGHYFIHYDPIQCRSLTVREAARIQTFPDNYLFCGTRTAQYHQVGNAVPPLLAEQIAHIILNIFI